MVGREIDSLIRGPQEIAVLREFVDVKAYYILPSELLRLLKVRVLGGVMPETLECVLSCDGYGARKLSAVQYCLRFS